MKWIKEYVLGVSWTVSVTFVFLLKRHGPLGQPDTSKVLIMAALDPLK